MQTYNNKKKNNEKHAKVFKLCKTMQQYTQISKQTKKQKKNIPGQY